MATGSKRKQQKRNGPEDASRGDASKLYEYLRLVLPDPVFPPRRQTLHEAVVVGFRRFPNSWLQPMWHATMSNTSKCI